MSLGVIGDGAIVRAALEALVEFLKRFAAPTGTRGSVLFMWGGLIIIGFLFLTFLFRSAIVGDLAPVANARTPAPRVLLPGAPPPANAEAIPAPSGKRMRDPFDAGRLAGHDAGARTLDAALGAMHALGLDGRIIGSGPERKRFRAYACISCAKGDDTCEFERGLLAGTFETLGGKLAKVEEVACRRRGDAHCEFEIRHAPLRQPQAVR